MVRIDKFAQRRDMLAAAALAAIAETGYAQTGLRDIAQHSELSHGSLHYYFHDKDDLIALAVWNYKSKCARRYDSIIATASNPSEFSARFAEEIVHTLTTEARLHRLWYDLRNQAMFDPGFRDTIVAIDDLLEQMVWAIVTRYAELASAAPRSTPEVAYAMFDGLFQNTMIRYLRGDNEAPERLRRDAHWLLGTAVVPV